MKSGEYLVVSALVLTIGAAGYAAGRKAEMAAIRFSPKGDETNMAKKSRDNSVQLSRSGIHETGQGVAKRLLVEWDRLARKGQQWVGPEAWKLQALLDQVDLTLVPEVVEELLRERDIQKRYALVTPLYRRWALSDPHAALASAKALVDPGLGSGVIEAIVASWASIDAVAAANYVSTVPEGKDKKRMLTALVEGATDTDPKAAFEMLQRLGNPRDLLSARLYLVWAQKNPSEALETLLKQPNASVRSLAVSEIFAEWTKNDPDRAIAQLKALKDSRLRNYAMHSCLRILADRDGQAAAAVYASLDPEDQRGRSSDVASGWAAQQPEAALAWAEQLSNRHERLDAVSAVLGTMLKDNHPSLKAHLAALPKGRERDSIVQRLLIESQNAPAEAIMELMALLPPQQQLQEATRLPRALSLESPEKIIALLEKNPIAADSGFYEQLARDIADSDPKKALAWALAMPLGEKRTRAILGAIEYVPYKDLPTAVENLSLVPEGKTRAQATAKLAGRWIHEDLDATVSWVLELTDETTKSAALDKIGEEWARQKPAEAAKFAASISDGERRDRFVHTVASEWAKDDSTSAIQWVNGLSDEALRTSALKGIVAGMAKDKPREAAAVVAALPLGKLQETTMQMVAQGWAREDPDSAANWIAAFPEGEPKNNFVSSLVGRWAADDPESALKWLRTQTSGEARVHGFEMFALQMTDQDPALAAQALSWLPLSEKRVSMAEFISRRWLEVDEPAARKWVSSLELPEEAKLRLLKPK